MSEPGPSHVECIDTRALAPLPAPVRQALRGARVGWRARSTASLATALREAETLGAQLVVFRGEHDEPTVAQLARTLQLEGVVRETERGLELERCGERRSGQGAPWLGVFTSGTSGAPKLVLHRWDRVRAPAAFGRDRVGGGRWLLAFDPTTYAGLQVLFTALASGATLVRAAGVPFADLARAMVHHGVTLVSATPTFWRLLVAAWPAGLSRPRLQQATFGGEYAPQATLDLVREAFSPERMTTVYASTEVGTALVVSDGREGFPAAWLEADDRPVQLRIRDGQLEVRSPYAMHGYFDTSRGEEEAGWFRTPDRAELRAGRLVLTGRVDTLVNVGGAKVAPEEVEHALLTHQAVLEAHVFPRPSPILGQVLVADVVARPGTAPVPAELRAHLAARLAPHAVPQLCRLVPALEVASSGKKRRV